MVWNEAAVQRATVGKPIAREATSFEIHREVAIALLTDSRSMRDRSLTRLEKIRGNVSGLMGRRWMQDWTDLLEEGTDEEILGVILGQGEYSDDMRQVSPMAVNISADARLRALERARGIRAARSA
ncbi:hypothetical protein F8O06_05465 [Pseudoclavibacter sp. CFCC 14310]|uniref:hypothetical protein n=1 Tax=Pseudoclavibacter sp. CFCC 14310 TaxID=2615180 RepID=UPI0013018FF9|nr:hypothetical protein [Pseudoclavibacter sp. CFCC 14310]KAB1646213.1 hypothetical protein F8O06_05465 [Pseudoclavibacter sp. CFCC 14310]